MKKIVTTYLPSVRSVQWNTLRSSITRPSMQKIKARYFTLQTEQARSIIGLLYGSWTESVSIFFSHELNWLSSVSRGNNIHAVGMHVQSWRCSYLILFFWRCFWLLILKKMLTWLSGISICYVYWVIEFRLGDYMCLFIYTQRVFS